MKQVALQHELALHQPKGLRLAKNRGPLAEFAPDLFIVAAYGIILPQVVLDLPSRGCVNAHASLLPRWRGAAPIERAMMAGDSATGVTLMQMDAGLDTGPILARTPYEIRPEDTGGSVETALAAASVALLVEHLPALLDGTLPATAQPAAGVTYADKLTRADAAVDWHQSATQISHKIQALSDRMPVEIRNGADRVKLLRARPAQTSELPSQLSQVPGTSLGFNSLGDSEWLLSCGPNDNPTGLAVSELLISTRGKGKAMTAATAKNGFHELLGAGAHWS